MVTYQKNFVIKVIYFQFSIVNCPYLCSHKALSPAYGFFVSQFTRFAWACSTYEHKQFQGKILIIFPPGNSYISQDRVQ